MSHHRTRWRDLLHPSVPAGARHSHIIAGARAGAHPHLTHHVGHVLSLQQQKRYKPPGHNSTQISPGQTFRTPGEAAGCPSRAAYRGDRRPSCCPACRASSHCRVPASCQGGQRSGASLPCSCRDHWDPWSSSSSSRWVPSSPSRTRWTSC